MFVMRIIVTLVCLLATAFQSASAALPDAGPIDDFRLNDHRGKETAFRDFAGHKLLIVAFLGVECPLAKRYATRLEELSQEYADRGLAILAIDANAQDSLAEIAAFARRLNLTYPILKDEANRVADQFAATRTPEVFLLDAARVPRYHGRIDDQYGIGYVKSAPQHEELRAAIEDLLADRPVALPHAPAVGCRLGRRGTVPTSSEASPSGDSQVTYSCHIAPILRSKCVECHRDGEIAPMALIDYPEVAGWAEMIDEVVQERRMPPWHADPRIGHFANDRSLTDEERELIHRWVETGAAEGDPAKVPPLPTYTQGWQLPRPPDLVVPMGDQPFQVPAEGEVRYQYFRVDPGFTEDKWVTAAEILPGNRAVVHHVLVFARPKGSRKRMDGERGFLAGYVPGSRVRPYPEGLAKRIPANSEIVFQVHYTPIGTAESDLTRIGFQFADPATIKQEVHTTSVVQTRLRIPPREGNYQASATLEADLPACELLLLSPHMHLRGKSFRYELILPDGTREPLLNVPRYDFNWQTAYWLTTPKPIPEGSRIHCDAVFDNSEDNLNNPDPLQRVHWGDQTYDEMMIGYFDIAVPR